jgi:hypothetical protein
MGSLKFRQLEPDEANGEIDLQKKFRVPLRGQSPERITVARHQGHNLLWRLRKANRVKILFTPVDTSADSSNRPKALNINACIDLMSST